jgi:hypothetical protein
MITIKKISLNELPPLVQYSYLDDYDLFDEYFTGADNYMGCVNAQLIMIYEMAGSTRMNYYKVIYQKKAIGYVVSFENCLYSFCINIKYRKKDILLNWWDKVNKVMNKNFICSLYKQNERAIKFLQKNGMEIVEEDAENQIVTLIKK